MKKLKLFFFICQATGSLEILLKAGVKRLPRKKLEEPKEKSTGGKHMP